MKARGVQVDKHISKQAKASLQRKNLPSYVQLQPLQYVARIIMYRAAENSSSADYRDCLKAISEGRSTARDNIFIRLMQPIEKHLH